MSQPTNPVTGISQYDVDSAESTMSLQSYIELEYVKAGNATLVNTLGSLTDSLGTTQQVLDLLTNLQTLKNMIQTNPLVGTTPAQVPVYELYYQANPSEPEPTGGKAWPVNQTLHLIDASDPGSYGPALTGAQYTQYYQAWASTYYNQPVTFSFDSSQMTLASAASQFVLYANQLSADVTKLSAVTPRLSTGTPGVTEEDPNSLLAKVRSVLTDIRTKAGLAYSNSNAVNATKAPTALTAWITDSYSNQTPGATSVGAYQNNLSLAITAGQSLNNTQSTGIQNYLFVFEEFYKSAAALITAINQIIVKMADGIKQ